MNTHRKKQDFMSDFLKFFLEFSDSGIPEKPFDVFSSLHW